MRDRRAERAVALVAATVVVLAVAALRPPDDAGPASAPVSVGTPPSQLAGAADAAASRTAPVERPPAAASPSPATAAPSPSPSPASTEASTIAPAIVPWSVEVHSGLGVWIDVFDWSLSHGGPTPAVELETIDALAAQGVRTVYLQTARITAPDAVLERDRLEALIDRIHANEMFVVGWYLPTFVDPEDDWRRIAAAFELDIDGFALDIESQEVADAAERSERLLAMSARLRALAGDRALVANVLPPVPLEDLNTATWPGFPWAELDAFYDVWMPMAYFTFRGPGNGEQWRDAEAYTVENIRRIRERVGDPDAPVHLIGGIADRTTVADVEGMTRGALREGALGLSLYDVATTGPELWAPMQAWRDLAG